MIEYFTVDRSQRLTPGIVLDKDANYDGRKFWPIEGVFTKADLSQLVEELYPGGLTEHGKRYLLDECLVIRTPNGPAPAVPNVPMMELLFELVRRLEFPYHISRFEAIFGWETIDEAETFRESFGERDSVICSVRCEDSAKLDMSLLYLGGSTIGSLLYARKYWRGESGNAPKWEILMRPPVEVVEVIAT